MKLTTRPLTLDLWPAFEDLSGANGGVGGCRCMYGGSAGPSARSRVKRTRRRFGKS
jgi:hypothetical protein